MLEINLKGIPKLQEILQAPSETKICPTCDYPRDIEKFGWRIMFDKRLETCKYCRNRQAKIDRELKKHKQFNAVTQMSWKPK